MQQGEQRVAEQQKAEKKKTAFECLDEVNPKVQRAMLNVGRPTWRLWYLSNFLLKDKAKKMALTNI